MPVTIGIIYPPPEVRSIVDKTATFVARNGPEFEEKIRQNEITNVKFNFLNPTDPYHAYYQHKVKEIEEGKDTSAPVPQPTSTTPAPSTAANNSQSIQSNMQKLSLSARTLDTQSRIIEQIIIPKEPPPDFDYIVDAPSIMPLDIDIIKLTAQFVARNGGQFRNNLMNKEQRNPLFDFLKPQHSHFSYFTRLVEQYSRILLPPKDLVEKLKKEVDNPFGILKDVAYRVEWEKVQQREKAKVDELAEKERVAYAQIDWHDFVVVETVDYQPNEIGNFPPPTTPEDVGARIIALERIEVSNTDGSSIDYNSKLLMNRIIDDEARIELSSLSAKQNQVEIAPNVERGSQSADKNIDEVAMDEDSDQEEDAQRHQKQKSLSQKAAALAKKDILPPNPDHVIIRKDYDPKQKQQQQQTSKSNSSEAYFKSPLTGELIPASSISEHMRISMLNPNWIEQKQKEKKEREEQEEVLASGVSIEKNLKRLAEYRSDVFGSGAEEVLIGKKVGEEEKKKDELAAWDGHTNSVEKTAKRAMTGITVEDQIKAIHQSQGIVEDDLSKIGPSIPKLAGPGIQTMPTMQSQAVAAAAAAAASKQQPQQTIMLSSYKILNVPAGAVRPTLNMPQSSTQQQFGQGMDTSISVGGGEEPASKRLKTEDQLISESEFLALHSHKGPVKFNVQIPTVLEKPEWNLNGQLIPFTMPLTETVANIKNKLMEYLTMPIGKQKLQLENIFIKDTNTLAFYNLMPDATIHLQLKERGGRKK